MAERILVLGGARSGKSRVAEGLVGAAPQVVYVATGSAVDPELAERVAVHRARRPAGWQTDEAVDVAAALRRAPAGSAVVVDALGPWLAAAMSRHGLWPPAEQVTAPLGAGGRSAADALVAEAADWWRTAGDHPGGPVVVVADESGLGVTPADPASRRWLDLAGAVVQALSDDADRVLLVVAGRTLALDRPRPAAAAADSRLRDLSAHDAGSRLRDLSAPDADSHLRDLSAHDADSHLRELSAHGDAMVPPGALDLAVNVVGPGPPPHLRKVVEAALDDLGRYPDPTAARAAAATRHGRDAEEVLITAGAADALRLVAVALRPRRAAVLHPQFTEPEAALRAAGAAVTRVLRDEGAGWRLDPRAVPADADVVVLGNPSNPTGTLDDPEAIAALARPGRTLVVDEAFMDFVPDERRWSLAHRDVPGLVVVRSMTKLWGLPGLRAGYLLADRATVRRLEAARQPWPVSGPALAAVAACCDDEPHRAAVAAEVAAVRARMAARLGALPGVRVTPGAAANFLLVAVADGPAVHRGLLERGIAVRPSTFPGLDRSHLRVAVRDDAATERLVGALADVLRSELA